MGVSQYEVNESAIQEYRLISDKYNKENILVLIEEDTTFAGLTKGLMDRNRRLVKHMLFSQYKITYDIAKHYCFDYITMNTNFRECK